MKYLFVHVVTFSRYYHHVMQCAVDPDTGAPTDDLLADAKKALASIGCKFTKVSEVVAAKDENVDKAIMDGIKKYNEKAVSNAQKVGLGV